jgi:hypothetical protein
LREIDIFAPRNRVSRTTPSPEGEPKTHKGTGNLVPCMIRDMIHPHREDIKISCIRIKDANDILYWLSAIFVTPSISSLIEKWMITGAY